MQVNTYFKSAYPNVQKKTHGLCSSSLCESPDYKYGTVYIGSGCVPDHIFLRVNAFHALNTYTTVELPFHFY